MSKTTPASQGPNISGLGNVSAAVQPITDIYNFGLILRTLLSKHVIDQPALVYTITCAFLADIQLCLMGPSGQAKTHAAETMAKILGIDGNTFPLKPGTAEDEITGYMKLDLKTREMVYHPGPFTGKQMVILDELNRTSDKAQDALLYILAHRKVIVDGKSYPLSRDFTTIMTMNPPEDGGTRRLIEALCDRIDYVLAIQPVRGQSLEDVISYICSPLHNNVENAFRDQRVSVKDPFTEEQLSFEVGNVSSLICDARAVYRHILENYCSPEVKHTARLITEEFSDPTYWRIPATPRTGAAMVKMATIWALVGEGKLPTSRHVWQVAAGCLGLVEPQMWLTTSQRLDLIKQTIRSLHERLRHGGQTRAVAELPVATPPQFRTNREEHQLFGASR